MGQEVRFAPSKNMLKDKNITFIGSGNLAEALIKGLILSSALTPERIWATDISADRLKYMADKYKVNTATDNHLAAQKSEIILLAVKPQIIVEALDQISASVDNSKLIISVAAGIDLEIIQKILSKKTNSKLRLVRAMPNTPALALSGATALSKGENASEEDMKLSFEIFEAVGKVVNVEENLMDAVTGLSGSGPAYIFLIIDALADAGVKVGLPRDIALGLSIQTVLGSAKLALESKEHIGKLKDMVTSPGGTTIAGLHSLETGGLKAILMNAVESATKRSGELGAIQRKKAGIN